MKLPPSLLSMCVLWTGACTIGDQPRGPIADAVRDSVGVQIVTHSARTVAAAPVLEPVEELRIGSVDGAAETQFVRVGPVELDTDGTIWMYDGGAYRVRVFGGDGRFIRAFGGRGSGPGEFTRSVAAIVLRPDSVLVFELGRLHVFARDGTSLHTQNTRSDGERALVSGAIATADGLLVLHQVIPDRQGVRGGPFRDSITVRRFDVATANVSEPIRYFGGPQYHLFGAAGWYMSPLFAPESKFGFAPNGTMYFTEGGDYHIDIFARDGSPVRRLLADVERIPVTDADMRAYIERQLADNSGGGEGAEYRRTFEKEADGLGHAEFRPVVGRIYAGDDGSLLVERIDLDDEPFVSGDDTTWDLVDADGRIVGRVPLAAKVSPRRFTGTHLFAVARDDDDVQYLVRYRLR